MAWDHRVSSTWQNGVKGRNWLCRGVESNSERRELSSGNGRGRHRPIPHTCENHSNSTDTLSNPPPHPPPSPHLNSPSCPCSQECPPGRGVGGEESQPYTLGRLFPGQMLTLLMKGREEMATQIEDLRWKMVTYMHTHIHHKGVLWEEFGCGFSRDWWGGREGWWESNSHWYHSDTWLGSRALNGRGGAKKLINCWSCNKYIPLRLHLPLDQVGVSWVKRGMQCVLSGWTHLLVPQLSSYQALQNHRLHPPRAGNLEDCHTLPQRNEPSPQIPP